MEGDWWAEPIPPNVQFGRRLLLRDRADFSSSSQQDAATPSSSAITFPVMPAALSRSERTGHCAVGDFTLVNGALIMAEERIEIGSYCLISWNVGIADSDFHPLEPAQRLIDAQALAPFFKDRPPRPKFRTAPVIHRRQRLDRNERDDSERRDDWRKLRRRRGIGRHAKASRQ